MQPHQPRKSQKQKPNIQYEDFLYNKSSSRKYIKYMTTEEKKKSISIYTYGHHILEQCLSH